MPFWAGNIFRIFPAKEWEIFSSLRDVVTFEINVILICWKTTFRGMLSIFSIYERNMGVCFCW
jgi:hypothetical protein